MANVLDCIPEVSEFDLQLHYYIHFLTNTLGKVMDLLILPALFVSKDGFGIK